MKSSTREDTEERAADGESADGKGTENGLRRAVNNRRSATVKSEAYVSTQTDEGQAGWLQESSPVPAFRGGSIFISVRVNLP